MTPRWWGRLALVGWLLVVAITLWPPAWLLGPGSLLATLLPGTQHTYGFEGIEGVWIVCTLPVLVALALLKDR